MSELGPRLYNQGDEPREVRTFRVDGYTDPYNKAINELHASFRDDIGPGADEHNRLVNQAIDSVMIKRDLADDANLEFYEQRRQRYGEYLTFNGEPAQGNFGEDYSSSINRSGMAERVRDVFERIDEKANWLSPENINDFLANATDVIGNKSEKIALKVTDVAIDLANETRAQLQDYRLGAKMVSQDVRDITAILGYEYEKRGGQSGMTTGDVLDIASQMTTTGLEKTIDKFQNPAIKKTMATLVLAGVLGGGLVSQGNKTAEASIDLTPDQIELVSVAIEIGALDSKAFTISEDERLVVSAQGSKILQDQVDKVENWLDTVEVSNNRMNQIESQRAPEDVESASLATELAKDNNKDKLSDKETLSDDEYIDWLMSQVKVTPEDYERFAVDTSRLGVFDAELSGKVIDPKAFVIHWTAGLYNKGVDEFVSNTMQRDGNCCNSMYFMNRDGQVYRFYNASQMGAHAKGANSWSQGVEIEARDLRDYTPEQMESLVMLTYRFLDARDIEISPKAILAHSEVTPGKIDPPAGLARVIYRKVAELHEATRLKGRETGKQSSSETNGELKDNQKIYGELLDMIASGEGSWDSINRRSANDTKLYADSYKQALDGRKLTELTIAEVLAKQASKQIFATGRYQMIPVTLKVAVESTGIDVNRKYDELAQNELAINYLLLKKRTKLAEYLMGRSNDLNEAQKAIAYEWASLPGPDGHGMYDGDKANNKANGGMQRVAELRRVLSSARNAYLAKHQTTNGQSAPTNMSNPDTIKVDRSVSDSIPTTSTTIPNEDKSAPSIPSLDTVIVSDEVIRPRTVEKSMSGIDNFQLDNQLTDEQMRKQKQEFLTLIGGQNLPKGNDGQIDIDKLFVMFDRYLQNLPDKQTIASN